MAEQLNTNSSFKRLAAVYWEENHSWAGTTGLVYKARMKLRDEVSDMIASKAAAILRSRDKVGGRRFLKRLEGIMDYETRLDKGHPFEENLLMEIIIKLANPQE